MYNYLRVADNIRLIGTEYRLNRPQNQNIITHNSLINYLFSFLTHVRKNWIIQ